MWMYTLYTKKRKKQIEKRNEKKIRLVASSAKVFLRPVLVS